jgi:hypothetical protein
MPENINGQKTRRTRKRKFFFGAFALIAAVFFGLYLAAKIFLGTPHASRLLSEFLTDFLHQRVTVTGLSLSGATISVRGMTIANPAGFQKGALLSTASIIITPNWPGILAGNRDFTLIQVEGASLRLSKNPGGDWNYRQFLHFLTLKKKKPAAEVFIKRLVLRDVSLQINNFSWKKLSLTVNDFSTKGSTGSKLLFTGKDTVGNPFRLAGEARLGKNPDVSLTLLAPNFSLDTVRNVTRSGSVLDLDRGMAHVSLSARYRSGDLAAQGSIGFEKMKIMLKGERIPVAGTLAFTAGYNAARDEARLERCALTLDNVIRLKADVIVRRVKGEKEFLADLSCAEMRGKDLLPFVPRKLLRDFSFDGKITCSDLHVEGAMGKGITAGGGRVLLRNGEVFKEGSVLFRNISADVKLAKVPHGWDSAGTLSLRGEGGRFPLEELAARFVAHLSDGFRPAAVEVPRLQARLKGVPVRGELTYAPRARNPYKAALIAGNVPVTAINDLLGRKNVNFCSGTADITIHAAGRGPASFTGELTARLLGINGIIAGKAVKLHDADINTHFGKTGGVLSMNGKTNIGGGAYADKSLAGSFAFVLKGDSLSLTGGKFDFNHTAIRFAGISGRLPVRQNTAQGARYPLSFTFSALELTAGETHIRDASGGLIGAYVAATGGRRLVGNGNVTLPSVSYRNQPIASLKTQVSFAGEEGALNLQGTALGGTLASLVRFDPFATVKGITFDTELRDVRPDKLSALFPAGILLKASGGGVDAKLSGTYSAQQGVKCRVEASGNGINLAGKGGKVLVMGAGFTLKGDMAGPNISVREARITQGENVAVKIDGSMTNAASSSRQGKLSIELGATPVNSLLDAFANMLPKPLQQANGAGSLGMRGALEITDGKTLLEGAVQFDNAMVDIPEQKVSVSGIAGSLPFSLYLSGAKVEKPSDALTFSKENYPALLKNLRQRPKTGLPLKIAKVRFGALETGDISLYLKADNGRIDVTSVESSLYNGTSIGKGYFLYDNGFYYATDILISDMSLRLFCSSYPSLKGYISGQLDGIISLYGGKGGIPALIGFVDLWAHKGKGEKMLVSKEFLQRLAGKKLRGFFFREDRPYNKGEISAYLEDGYLTFEELTISHTNFLGMKDLSVSVAPVQNKIGLEHLFQVIREAAARGKVTTGGAPAPEAPPQTDLKWLE